jgi:hypothetical protein
MGDKQSNTAAQHRKCGIVALLDRVPPLRPRRGGDRHC